MRGSSKHVAVSHQGGEIGAPAALAVQLALAYQVSHAVYVATRLGVPDQLSKGALSIDAIALRTGTKPEKMRRLLRALAAFEIVRDLGEDRFELASAGAWLRADSPRSVRPLVLMYGSDHARQAFGGLEESMKTGKNAFEITFGVADSFRYFNSRPDLGKIFDDGMSAASAFTGPAAARAYEFDAVRHVVDVGGGHGNVLAAILCAHPHLRATLFDLPRVIEDAPALLVSNGVADRCSAVAGDMFDAVPADGDLYMLCHVIHNWDDPHATRVLQSCRRAMSADTKLIILDRLMPERIEPDRVTQGNTLIDLMMMVRTRGGRERTADEFKALLASADLSLHRIIPTDISESVIEAKPV